MRYVSYCRCSTSAQGESKLGLEAQKHAIQTFIQGRGELVGEFSEVISSTKNEREELAKAIALAKKHKATLVIARLDRLLRSLNLLVSLRDSGVEFVAVDMPHADRFVVNILACVAEKELSLIRARVKDALAAAKRRGTKLGNPRPAESLKRATAGNVERARAYAANLLPVIAQVRASGITTLRGIATCLNARGFKTPRGCAFEAQTVKNILARG